jgi:hypothetical protein
MQNTLFAFGLGVALCMLWQTGPIARPVVVPAPSAAPIFVPTNGNTLPDKFGYQGAALEGTASALTPYQWERMERYLALSEGRPAPPVPPTSEATGYDGLWNGLPKPWHRHRINLAIRERIARGMPIFDSVD